MFIFYKLNCFFNLFFIFENTNEIKLYMEKKLFLLWGALWFY